MSYITLTEARRWLEVLHTRDDEMIQGCIDAAESYAATYMNRSGITDAQPCRWYPDLPASDQVVPPTVKKAILFLVAEYYENRSAAAVGSSDHVDAMLHLYRVGLGA